MTSEAWPGGFVAEVIRRLGPVAQTANPRWVELILTIMAYSMFVRPASERPMILRVMMRENSTRAEEIRAMEKTIAQVIEEQGELRAVRRALTSLLRSRLGECPEGLAQQIAETTNAEELQVAFDRVLGLDDLAGFQLRE